MNEEGLGATGDLPAEEFRAQAHAAVEWIARYLERIEDHPVGARVAPGDIRGALPSAAPRTAESLTRILHEFESVIVPGVTHWNHPGFMAYFAITGSVPGIIGELLAAALNVNGMLWRTSPAVTELEEVTLAWLRQMMGLPGEWFGLLTDTASMSTMLALAAAREAPGELRVRELGMAGRGELPVLRVYASEESHSSVEKAAIALGIGSMNVVRIPADDDFRMDVRALSAAIAADRGADRLPLAVVATVGTTSTTSIDPVREIAAVCEPEGIWLHVDAAYAGAAALAPELRWVIDGVEGADSLVVNPHKWLFTPIDCSALYIRKPDVLRRAFSIVPEYLATSPEGEAVNLMDYGVQLGRRFRALKLWMIMRAFGSEGLASRIRGQVALAQQFAAWVHGAADWRVVAPHPLSVVCVRYQPPGMSDIEADGANARILERVNASGEVFLSHTRLRGRYVIRVAIGNLRTEERHVRRAWELLQGATPGSSPH